MSALPRVGEVIRDVERLMAQARQIINVEVDPASLPSTEDDRDRNEVHRLRADFHLTRVLQELAAMAEGLPAVGSAVVVPMTRPAPAPAQDPTSGPALAAAPAARPLTGPRFLPGPGEATQRIGGKHRPARIPPWLRLFG